MTPSQINELLENLTSGWWSPNRGRSRQYETRYFSGLPYGREDFRSLVFIGFTPYIQIIYDDNTYKLGFNYNLFPIEHLITPHNILNHPFWILVVKNSYLAWSLNVHTNP